MQPESTPDLVPVDLPRHPRVFVTEEGLQRCRSLTEETVWAQAALGRLLKAADAPCEWDVSESAPVRPEHGTKVLNHAFRQILAFHLTGRGLYLDSALVDFRCVATAYLRWPLVNDHTRAAPYGLAESRFTITLARVYDLIAPEGLAQADRELFQQALALTEETTDRCQHTTCGNHNTWNLVARLAAGLASGETGLVRDALHGWTFDGVPRYGLIHQLRHDILSDGLHWERTPGYHFYTLMALTDAAAMLANAGVDLWHAELPAQTGDDGRDLHRAYGPDGSKCLKAAFDAPFYATLGNGDFSLLYDSGLANLRGVWIWGPLYELAYQAYGDPKYAWLLARIEREYADWSGRDYPQLPMSLQPPAGEWDFVLLKDAEHPTGHFSLDEDCSISLVGTHCQGCTLFPVTGVSILRNRPEDAAGTAVQMFWGPHSAGHQSPAALCVDLYGHGRCLSASPQSAGYEDPLHKTWVRSTIAHNTVTVDGRPMIPYDVEVDSVWKTDGARGLESDGVLELFQVEGPFKACRASNEAVYPGIRLDRTLVLTDRIILDLFRVIGTGPHQYDYSMHIGGRPSTATEYASAAPLRGIGYDHLNNVRTIRAPAGIADLTWETAGSPLRAVLQADEGSEFLLADDPATEKAQAFGALEPLPRSSALVVRSRGDQAMFLSMWSTEAHNLEMIVEDGRADGDVVVRTQIGSQVERWHLPCAAGEVTSEQLPTP
ncbi:MAG: heparinase II/III family protein [Candidatus Latescibacterota bacterium]|nr:heparinase II/III family protein [Candidatus Latescibacterota bacterium]